MYKAVQSVVRPARDSHILAIYVRVYLIGFRCLSYYTTYTPRIIERMLDEISPAVNTAK